MGVQKHLIANSSRLRTAWLMRQDGAKLRTIANALGCGVERARKMILEADKRMTAAARVRAGHVTDPVAYGVWHTFTPEGRVNERGEIRRFE